MKTFTIFFGMALLMSSTVQAEYVRKNVKPNFFIPSHELNRVEKLPPLKGFEHPQTDQYVQPVIPEKADISAQVEAENTEPQNNMQDENKYHIIDTQTKKEDIYINLLPIELMQEENPPLEIKDNILPENKKAKYDSSLENDPQYKKMKEQYSIDLREIEKNGKAPQNSFTQETLAKMNSDDTFSVDENFNQKETLF